MVSEKEIQSAKEKAVLLALKKGMALIRRDLEIHGIKVDGKTMLISKSKSHDTLWQDALKSLEE